MIGVYYYPEQWPREDWEKDIRKMKSMGMHHVHMAEFAWIHMEPRDHEFDFDWLDCAVELVIQNEMDVILCTPTAALPIWLTENHPDVLMVKANGRVVQHGSRGHRCVNSPTFNMYAERITQILAKRYGTKERVIGWQIDNELGHYTDAPCYCQHCQNKFQEYLRSKYDSDIEQLNKAWAGDFWSQNYQQFEQIRLPNRETLVYFPNEHAQLDFLRFFSFSHTLFLERQARLLRKYIHPKAWITHNFMTNDPYVYPRHVKSGLDLFTLTNYPVAGVYKGKAGRQLHRIGDMIDLAFHQDYSRCHNGHWGVMEQQPGQVNWGPYNCRVYPGAVRLWLWAAIVHGAELLDTYRFRQPSSGAEQYHEGLLALDGETLSQGGREFKQVASELKQLQGLWEPLEFPQMPKAAILYDWSSLTAISLHPQSESFDVHQCWRRFYGALKRLGFQVDVICSNRDIHPTSYEVVVVACSDLIDDTTIGHWKNYVTQGGHLVVSPRVATRNLNGHFPKTEYGQRIADLVGAKCLGYDVMPKGHWGKIQRMSTQEIISWYSWAEQWQPSTQSTILASHKDQFYAGSCAAFRTSLGKGIVTLIGFDAQDGVESIMIESLQTSFPKLQEIPENCMYHTRGQLGVFLNFNDQPVEIPDFLIENQSLVIGKRLVGPADLSIWRLKSGFTDN